MREHCLLEETSEIYDVMEEKTVSSQLRALSKDNALKQGGMDVRTKDIL